MIDFRKILRGAQDSKEAMEKEFEKYDFFIPANDGKLELVSEETVVMSTTILFRD
tara:strand:- start:613 stop:777 length:165 start_codon:yes stop_codon:yes gene_type:complete